jgi:hypothetical protein
MAHLAENPTLLKRRFPELQDPRIISEPDFNRKHLGIYSLPKRILAQIDRNY